MGNNKPIDKRVVQKVFETSAAGESRSTVGAFFIVLVDGLNMF